MQGFSFLNQAIRQEILDSAPLLGGSGEEHESGGGVILAEESLSVAEALKRFGGGGGGGGGGETAVKNNDSRGPSPDITWRLRGSNTAGSRYVLCFTGSLVDFVSQMMFQGRLDSVGL